ncbi:hypothetical protein ACFQ4C_12105 [Larkinella insperata]|uniref:Nucleotidyltransferase n=1 Tax=Larkinella insperata TaxID=332158 RepID=A0ABW3QM48_9BACT|nr:hypothetical protein [Larkinella insperata]
MSAVFNIRILWNVVKDITTYLTGQADKKKENVIEGHKAINTAFILTYDYLRNNNGEYKPNTELAEVWNKASAAIMKVDLELGKMLYNKSRFWLDPRLYFNLSRESEIIELNRIVDEMERLIMKL